MSVETLTIQKGKEKFELPVEPTNWILAREVGYSPVQMLVTATATCGGYVYSSVLENSHIPYKFDKIEVSYDRDQSKQAEPLSAIDITFFVHIEKEYQEKALRCVKLVSKNCPVIQSLDKGIQVTETVVFN